MSKRPIIRSLFILTIVSAGLTNIAAANVFHARAHLRPYEEVPAVSSLAFGDFRLRIEGDLPDPADTSLDPENLPVISWELRYRGITTPVRAAHIHLGQRGVNGGVVVTLCSNAMDAPPEVADCPQEAGEVSGTISPADVGAGAAAQGIAAGELRELLRAIRAGVTYVNVHSDAFPGGEMRGQLVSNYRRYLP